MLKNPTADRDYETVTQLCNANNMGKKFKKHFNVNEELRSK